MFLRKLSATLLVCAGLLAACNRHGFEPGRFDTSDALYNASLAEYERGRWPNAARGFEQLTTDLPARDPRLPSVFYYLGKTQQHMREHLTAAQTFRRLYESFPDDTLADDALFEAGHSYARLWRKPAHDAEHGISAINVYRTLIAVYPTSPMRSAAEAETARLEDWLAIKDYDTGYHYLRRGAYDSAIIYFRGIIELYPHVPKARETYLRLLETYRAIRYMEDARELCTVMLNRYSGDAEIAQACAGVGVG